ncbi:MAG: hypothetical protein K1X53_12865 [Candidatus Sumerlaeaceae bacterium]|nr:hypothetical protein [Candidatus Sumerlaeaceae bacterium]
MGQGTGDNPTQVTMQRQAGVQTQFVPEMPWYGYLACGLAMLPVGFAFLHAAFSGYLWLWPLALAAAATVTTKFTDGEGLSERATIATCRMMFYCTVSIFAAIPLYLCYFLWWGMWFFD